MASPPSETDEEWRLVERVRNGDLGAFEGLVRRHMRRAFSVAYRILGHREDAEDLVQEAFLAALEGIDSFQPGRPFGPWLHRIVVNRGYNARKARALREMEAIPEDTPGSALSPEASAERAELRARLARAMTSLSGRQRLIVRLFELEGFSGEEIADILEIPPGTVRWDLHRARATLRACLEAAEPNPAPEKESPKRGSLERDSPVEESREREVPEEGEPLREESR